MKALALIPAALAATFAGFIAGLHVHFPSDAALTRLRYEVQDRSKGEWGIEASDLDLYWLTGVSLDDATIYKVKKSRFRRRNEEEKPPEVRPWMSAERLVARLQLLPLIRGGTMVDYDADLYGGTLEGEAGRVGSITRFAAQGRDIDLSRIPIAGDDWSADLTGSLVLDADVDIDREEYKKSEGSFRVAAQDLALVAGEFSGFKLEPMKFTDAVLAFEIDNGVAKVKEGHLASDLLEATISGEITLNKDMKRWRLRLTVVVTLNETLDKLARFSPTMSEARAEDGTYHFIMAGTPGLARLRPDRLGAKGDRDALDDGPRPGPVGRPGMQGPEDGPPMMEEEPPEEGEELSAEERRERRLERIRKARERRKAREAEREAGGGDMPEGGPGRMPPFQRGGPMGDPMEPGQDGPGWEDEQMMPGEGDFPPEPFDQDQMDEPYDPNQ